MRDLNKKQKFLLLLFLGVFFIYSFNALKESDSFYHLKTGQLIWETKQVPTLDPFSYLAPGAKWVAHEWLAELIFFGAWKLGGFWGLIAFVALVAVLTYFLSLLLALKKGANFYVALPLLFLFSALTFELWIPRPQIFSFLFLVAELFLVEGYKKTGAKRYLAGIGLLIWLWANIHASVILGLGIIFIYATVELCKKIWPKLFVGEFDKRYFKALVWSGLGATALSLLNPNGFGVLTYIFSINKTVKILDIAEWRSIMYYFSETGTKLFLAEIALSFSAIFWWFGLRKEGRDPLAVVLAVLFAAMPFLSIRYVGYWPLATFSLLALPMSFWFSKISGKLREGTILGLLFFAGIALALIRMGSFPRQYFNSDTVPVYAADFIEKEGIKGPLFNFYNEGGYFIWRFWPNEKVSIDGRSEVYGDQALSDFFNIVRAGKNWDYLVNERYKINYFALPYRQPGLVRLSIPLLGELSKNKWPLIYWDDTLAIFIRPSDENKQLIDKFALYHASPYRDPVSIPKEEGKAVAAELQRLLEAAPDSKVLRDWSQLFLMSASQK